MVTIYCKLKKINHRGFLAANAKNDQFLIVALPLRLNFRKYVLLIFIFTRIYLDEQISHS